MAKKGGLGRGLDALMNTDDAVQGNSIENAVISPVSKIAMMASLPEGVESDDDGALWVNVDLLKPNPHQPRKDFDDDALAELAASIKAHGIVQPILIEPAGEKNFYIIAGERRTRAAKLAGVTKVPVQIRRYDEQKRLEVALIENIQRANLNPIEEAAAYSNLMRLGEMSQDEVAARVGKNRSTVANAMRLLKLPDDMQKALIDGTITAGHARALLSVVNEADMRVLFGKIISSNLSVRETEQLAVSFNGGGRAADKKKAQKEAAKKDVDILAIEQQFIESLGTKCALKGTLEKGTIEISYFSRADLDRLYTAIVEK